MLCSLRATTLNGTDAAVDGSLRPTGTPGIFLFAAADGQPFADLGQIGASVFKDEIGDNAQRLVWISVEDAPEDTTYLDYWVGVASPGDALANMPAASVKRRIDLTSGATRGEGLLIPGANYALFLDSDADGSRSISLSFEVVAETSVVAQSVRSDPSSAGFGPDVAAPSYVLASQYPTNWLAVQTADVTVQAGDIVPCDTGFIFTVTLPANPLPSQSVRVLDVSGNLNIITVDGNGKNVQTLYGSEEPFFAGSQAMWWNGTPLGWWNVLFTFDGTTWLVMTSFQLFTL